MVTKPVTASDLNNILASLESTNFSYFLLLNYLFLTYRTVYHCPFCNLCRLGKGLGVDFFHCMTCNCCLGKMLVDHKCREKGLEMNCPICCDFLFTSSASVKALPCGHFMHSACFQVSLDFTSLVLLIAKVFYPLIEGYLKSLSLFVLRQLPSLSSI